MIWNQINLLETKPNIMPLSVDVIMPEMLVNIRLVMLRKPFADKLKPLPNPISTSAHPSGDVILLKETLTDPPPVPLWVERLPTISKVTIEHKTMYWLIDFNIPDRKAVSFKVSGASIAWEKLIPLTSIDGKLLEPLLILKKFYQ